MHTEINVIEKLTELYKTNPYIHIDACLVKPRVEIKNMRVKLVGVYNHIFIIEEEGKVGRHSLQYGDVVAGILKIAELEE